MTLTEFLLARFADDEIAIRARWRGGDMTDESYWNTPYQPSRLLAECEAKRQIVALHRRNDVLADLGVLVECLEGCIGAYPCETLRTLAMPYAAHPDYQQEWKS